MFPGRSAGACLEGVVAPGGQYSNDAYGPSSPSQHLAAVTFYSP
jgi:hypothetical protein